MLRVGTTKQDALRPNLMAAVESKDAERLLIPSFPRGAWEREK